MQTSTNTTISWLYIFILIQLTSGDQFLDSCKSKNTVQLVYIQYSGQLSPPVGAGRGLGRVQVQAFQAGLQGLGSVNTIFFFFIL